MRILLLEDEESIRGFVRINLKRNDMEVIEAETGEAALALAANEGHIDIALLDVMLPTISGFEVCEQLRALYPRMGIIMLTAKSQEEDKIHGLELGADDYVQKPFSPGELIARIKSLYRRMKPGLPEPAVQAAPVQDQLADRGAAVELGASYHYKQSESVLSASGMNGPQSVLPPAQAPIPYMNVHQELIVHPFRLSVAERKLWKQHKEIILTPTEWTLVRLLMERVGESVSRDHILTEVWGRYYVGDLKVVDVNIRRIRQKIEKNPSDPAFIETVWGYGYRWKRSNDE
ncbi:DNA-binding response OmpR family regulator [Paenibacillus endophyticus]|uniref:DNA-binding response OmpR family regulator n=1 Tax=Paenibacillus endophyticus TaxID=1294268 RepID=A0A7W5CAN2_9BACL|nr:response regulator transcription factor [Paenibacillus endophyticus]MBB3153659.1 DNA-binding response OmpR family regulator [Paenibacillus endophyticus]